MRNKTARQKAEEMEMNVDEMVEALTSKSLIEFSPNSISAHFKEMCATAQNQLLKFCSDNNDTDAYNFYHSLI